MINLRICSLRCLQAVNGERLIPLIVSCPCLAR
jgi:hypothetical protein